MNAKVAVAIVLLAMAVGAAETQASSDKRRPVFSKTERSVIARNEALSHLVRTDPWTVRSALDVFRKSEVQLQGVPRGSAGRNKSFKPDAPSSEPGTAGYDPARNPDIEQLNRSSPEAAHDLFQLLKQAGSQRRSPK